MKSQTTWIIVGIIAVILGGMFFQSKYPIFSILPSGQYSAPSSCSFITNVNPYNGPWDSYGSGAYITMDINSDGIKEKFGYASTVSSSIRISECGGQSSSAIVMRGDFNSQGDDIYYLITGGQSRLYVCQADGTHAKYFIKDCTGNCASQIADAITVCTTTCTPNWVTGSWTACSEGTQTRTVTDSNNCGTTTGKPTTSQSCSVGTCKTDADTNCDGSVDRTELGVQINNWINNQITRSQLGSYITAWVGSTTTCTPSCLGKSCGDNGCGGSCGSCSSGQSCNAGQCTSSIPSGNFIKGSLCGNSGTYIPADYTKIGCTIQVDVNADGTLESFSSIEISGTSGDCTQYGSLLSVKTPEGYDVRYGPSATRNGIKNLVFICKTNLGVVGFG